MAARVVGIRQEGVNPCRMVPSTRDEVHVQLHDVTGRYKVRELRVAALVLRDWKKKIENKSKPRFRVNRIPWAGVKDPLVWAQDDH